MSDSERRDDHPDVVSEPQADATRAASDPRRYDLHMSQDIELREHPAPARFAWLTKRAVASTLVALAFAFALMISFPAIQAFLFTLR